MVSASKGIEEDTLLTMSEVLEEVLPGIESAVLSGPSHAEEVARSLPTACVVGAHREETAKELQSVFMSPLLPDLHQPGYAGN